MRTHARQTMCLYCETVNELPKNANVHKQADSDAQSGTL